MFFTKLKVNIEQLEVMIGIIDLEYSYKNDDELAALISRNFELPIKDVESTLRAYKTHKEEDYETISKKTIMYGKY